MSASNKQSQFAAGGGTPDITIFRGWKDFGKYVWSPFVIKLEARLRFAGVRYDVASGSTRTAPKGKIPYVDCRSPASGSPGATTQKVQLSDSTLIIKTLAEWGTIPDLNAAIRPEDRAKDLGLSALLEDKLYFYHGAGRFTPEEIARFRHEIWESFSDLLRASKAKLEDRKENPFWVLGGDDPTEADCVLFGFIVSVLICTAAPDSQKVVRSFPVLLEYADRIHDKYFPDYEKWPL
ncbi:hypothetical protein SLS62_004892 [Diatrype stigma]|uniref:Glutathione S-transferase n=1 Tax=Diatrype stigma TaxID=117547 RepID=A0AAN9UQ14_9PEZI